MEKRMEYLRDTFMRKIIFAKNGCWEYTGRLDPNGYGQFYVPVRSGKTKTMFAHRVAYALFVGKLKKGMFICHKCNNPCCCNPDHLYQGTPKDNVKDMIKAGTRYITWGERSGRHKLSAKQIREIRASNDRQIDLANKYGVRKSTISMIINYKSRQYE